MKVFKLRQRMTRTRVNDCRLLDQLGVTSGCIGTIQVQRTFVMLCTPADHPFGKVHIIPAQIQDCAEPLEGMSMSEGTIVKWFKQVGDRVEQGEPLVEIEDAKAVNTL